MGPLIHLMSHQVFTVWKVCVEITWKLLVNFLFHLAQSAIWSEDVRDLFSAIMNSIHGLKDQWPELWSKTRDVKQVGFSSRRNDQSLERWVSGTSYLLSSIHPDLSRDWLKSVFWYLVMADCISAILFRNQFQQPPYNHQDSLTPDIMDVAASPPEEFLRDL